MKRKFVINPFATSTVVATMSEIVVVRQQGGEAPHNKNYPTNVSGN